MLKISHILKNLTDDASKEEDVDLRGEIMGRIQEIAKIYEGDDRVVSSDDLAERIKNEPEEKKILSGYSELDSILDGFRAGQLVVLSGITKHGKTSFAVELTIRMKEERPLWFPFEEPAIDLIRKFTEQGAEPPHFFTPLSIKGNNLEWIESKIVESIAKFDTKLVFIDHLGFIQDTEGGRDENMAYKIERIVRTLKRMAVRWNVVIVLLAHLTKTKIDVNPSFDDLKGSSAIAQEADTVMLLWRTTNRQNGRIVITNEANLSIQANRRKGKTGNVRFEFNNGRYTQTEWQPEEMANNEIW